MIYDMGYGVRVPSRFEWLTLYPGALCLFIAGKKQSNVVKLSKRRYQKP